MQNHKKILVFTATYNEAGNINELINSIILQPTKLDLLIIDDNSPDGTSKIIEKNQEKFSNLYLIKRNGKLGLDTAHREAYEYALKKNYDCLITMDADGKATVHITKCEIGQHVGTALAQAVAEELEIDWNDVNVDYPQSHASWGLHITGGSWSVNWTFDRNSRVGASARIALVEAGSKMLNSSPSNCYAKSPIKTLKKAIIKKKNDEIIIQFESKSFLRHQVRSMVGCLKYLGEKKWSLKTFEKNFKSSKRSLCAPPAPAEGLFLEKVIY